jgi:plastocyanin
MKRLLVILGLLFLLAPARAEAATQHVAMENYAFSPATLTVHVGDTVTWTNHDQAAHNAVTTSGPAAFSSPLLPQGQSWSFTFTVPGTYAYYCSVHPDMRAQLVVLSAETTQAAPQPQAPQRNPPPAQAPPPAVTTTEAAAPPPPPTTAPTTTTTAPAQQTAQAAMTTSLDPMLLVAGLVAGVVILCLLLTSAKPE